MEHDDLSTIFSELKRAAALEREGGHDGLFARQVAFYADAIKRLPVIQVYIRDTAKELDVLNAVNAVIPSETDILPALDGLRPDDYSDVGNSKVFSRLYADRMVYCDSIGWLVWDGTRWAPDDMSARVNTLLLSDMQLQDAMQQFTETNDSAYLKHAQRTRNKARLDAMLDLSRAQMAVNPSQLDVDTRVLNTPSGIVDLRTGQITPCRRDAYCTKVTRASLPSGAHNGARWHEFLSLITGGDAEYALFLQFVIGAAAFGEIFLERMIVASGGGRNGKSTFFNAIAHVLGDYAGTLDSSALIATKHNDASPYLATLRGKRLILAGELEEGARLSVATVKRICSTDEIQARRLYHDPESFRPSHTVCMFTNFLPRVGSTDSGTWRRLLVLPFNAVMPAGDAEIPDYAHVLVDECGDEILSWVVDGAGMFAAAGFHLPPCQLVDDATAAYQTRENWLLTFIAERCETGAGYSVGAGRLFEAYREFAREQGDYAHRRTEFNEAMLQAGYERVSAGGHKVEWRGLQLTQEYAFRH